MKSRLIDTFLHFWKLYDQPGPEGRVGEKGFLVFYISNTLFELKCPALSFRNFFIHTDIVDITLNWRRGRCSENTDFRCAIFSTVITRDLKLLGIVFSPFK